MLKKSLLAVALVALLASMASAGEVKLDDWPSTIIYNPEKIADIPVVMDIGYWVFIPDQDDLQIKLHQTSAAGHSGKHAFEGNTDMEVRSNFDLTLSTSIAGTGAIGGDFSSWVTPDACSAGTNVVKVYARLTDANLGSGGLAAGMKDVHVATVTVRVVPQ